jgi:uncharacterized protein (DUF1800 family)
MSQRNGAIAATRFGMGAGSGEIADAASDPRGWLMTQIRQGAALITDADLQTSRQALASFAEYRRERQKEDRRPGETGQSMAPGVGRQVDASTDEAAAAEVRNQVQRLTRGGLQRDIAARTRHAATTRASFAERWARFWSNHFTVAARKLETIGLAGPYEREAIRPHVFGSFRVLLREASLHPGMLIYLDANRSVGPNAPIARRRDNLGLNENLAREILELHTLGVGSGYTQADIVEFAKALTGWTAGRGPGGGGEDGIGGSRFVTALHEPGPRTVAGRRYPEGGAEQAQAILDALAADKATARHVATKLARHFVADAPPPSAIARLERIFLATDGDLSELARAVIALPEAWAPEPVKFKTPDELLISLARLAGPEVSLGRDPRTVYQSLAQQPLGAPSPAGWSDTAETWSGSDAVMKRLEWANAAARRIPASLAPNGFLDQALGPLAGVRTREAIARAESAEQGLTLALMSPEFQRR